MNPFAVFLCFFFAALSSTRPIAAAAADDCWQMAFNFRHFCFVFDDYLFWPFFFSAPELSARKNNDFHGAIDRTAAACTSYILMALRRVYRVESAVKTGRSTRELDLAPTSTRTWHRRRKCLPEFANSGGPFFSDISHTESTLPRHFWKMFHRGNYGEWKSLWLYRVFYPSSTVNSR